MLFQNFLDNYNSYNISILVFTLLFGVMLKAKLVLASSSTSSPDVLSSSVPSADSASMTFSLSNAPINYTVVVSNQTYIEYYSQFVGLNNFMQQYCPSAHSVSAWYNLSMLTQTLLFMLGLTVALALLCLIGKFIFTQLVKLGKFLKAACIVLKLMGLNQSLYVLVC